MPHRRLFTCCAAALALGACVPRAERPAPVPAPAPAPTPAPAPVQPTPTPPAAPPPSNWADAPLTPGRWSYQPGAGGSEALFGMTGRPVLGLRCTGGGILLTVPAAASRPVTVRTSTMLRTLQLDGGAGGARLAAGDPLLDAIAFSRGRFAVEGAGLRLVIPAWPEPARVVEDCRRGGTS